MNPLADTEPTDAIRMSLWGPKAEDEIWIKASSLFRWIRHHTHQAWVGMYEAQTDSSLKYVFPIDEKDRALRSAMHTITFTSAAPYMRGLDDSIWRQSFFSVVRGESPPTYWQFFMDAAVYRGMRRVSETIMALVFSLEVARDTLYPKFAPTKRRSGVGFVLAAPFDNTKLLRHLSTDLELIRARSLKKELPDHWVAISSLVRARGNAAHGRTPLIRSSAGSKSVDDELLRDWSNAVYNVLVWMEGL